MINAKEELLKLFSKLLTTQIPIMSGYDAERDIIIHIRYILENCVVIPIEKINKISINNSYQRNVGGIKTTTYEKKIHVVSEYHFTDEQVEFLDYININDKLLKELIFYLEKE